MRYYFFDRHYGHDRVAQAATIQGIAAGDFFEARGIGYGLCLGDSLTWMEQYGKYQEKGLEDAEIISLGILFSPKSLVLLHRFTQHRFCTYKKAIPLWVGHIEELAKRKPSSLGKNNSKKDKKEAASAMSDSNQSLQVYPNLWSIMNDTQLDVKDKNIVLLHSQSTKKQKAEAYRGFQSGEKSILVCTYSQMFQDWSALTHISVYKQHLWYYKNQQDPRYHAVQVAQKMAEIYQCNLHTTGISLQSPTQS